MKSLLKLSLLMVSLILSTLLVKAALNPDDLHNIKIKDVFISDDSLQCPKILSVLVQVQNEGKTDENIFIELSSEKLRLSEVSQIFNIKPGSLEVANFDLNFPNGIEGEQEFEAAVFFNKKSHRIFKSFTFSECQKNDQSIVKDISEIKPPKKNNPQDQEFTISAPILFMIILLIIILILAILYIIKVYLQK